MDLKFKLRIGQLDWFSDAIIENFAAAYNTSFGLLWRGAMYFQGLQARDVPGSLEQCLPFWLLPE
jgi:hypothetical protein